jgi:hypothetical protein
MRRKELDEELLATPSPRGRPSSAAQDGIVSRIFRRVEHLAVTYMKNYQGLFSINVFDIVLTKSFC